MRLRLRLGRFRGWPRLPASGRAASRSRWARRIRTKSRVGEAWLLYEAPLTEPLTSIDTLSLSCATRPIPRLRLLRLLPQRSIWPRPLATHRGGMDADFGRQTPRPPTDFGRYRPLHDDRDGPAGEPSEDAPSGESEGRDVRRDGGGQGRRHGGPRPSPEALPPRSGVRGGLRGQPVRAPRPHGAARGSGAVRVRKEGKPAGHEP